MPQYQFQLYFHEKQVGATFNFSFNFLFPRQQEQRETKMVCWKQKTFSLKTTLSRFQVIFFNFIRKVIYFREPTYFSFQAEIRSTIPAFFFFREWIFGNVYCTVNNFIAYMSVSVSVFSLVAIAIDRYKQNIHKGASISCSFTLEKILYCMHVNSIIKRAWVMLNNFQVYCNRETSQA